MGFITAFVACVSDNKWFAVLHSYFTLHVWHRRESIQLNNFARSMGSDITFTDHSQQTALGSTFMAVVTYFVARLRAQAIVVQ